jgi:hypothetical protein
MGRQEREKIGTCGRASHLLIKKIQRLRSASKHSGKIMR